ncbi:MAG TPA: hypothetical protein VLT88_01475 [Desulfosarcina sp.]|nr:hypothetical protein [Desulfosarcina sp.]
MAKIRKCKLSWEASASENVVGYKLYWSRGDDVSYDSRYLKVGNVTEILLPDDVILSGGPVMFGVTAVDKDGNESDMVTMAEPYRLHVPEAPGGLSIKPSNEYRLVGGDQPAAENLQLVATEREESGDDEDPLARAIENDGAPQAAKVKYYDDIGYRRTP